MLIYIRNKDMKDLSIGMLNELYGNLLTNRQSEMIKAYYDFDLSLGEIAASEGISRQAVSDSIKKGEKLLLFYEDSLKFYDKSLKIKELISELESSELTGEEKIIIEKIKEIL